MMIRAFLMASLVLAAGGAWGCAPARPSRGLEPAAAATPTPHREPVSMAAASTPASSPVPAPAVAPPDAFAASVRPVLATRCAPCHNPGGKMYERMPFDDAGVVRSHADGIRKRLKGADLEALVSWLEAPSN